MYVTSVRRGAALQVYLICMPWTTSLSSLASVMPSSSSSPNTGTRTKAFRPPGPCQDFRCTCPNCSQLSEGSANSLAPVDLDFPVKMAVLAVEHYANSTSSIGQAQMQTLHTIQTVWTGTTTTTVRGVPQYPATTVYTSLQPVEMASYPDPIMSATGANLQCLLSQRRTGNSTSATTCEEGIETTVVASSSECSATIAMESEATGCTSTDTNDSMTQTTYTTRTTTTFTTLYPGIQGTESQLSLEPSSTAAVSSSISTSHSQSSIRTGPKPSSFTLVPWSLPTSQRQNSIQPSFEPISFTDLGPSTTTLGSSTQLTISRSTSTLSTISLADPSSPTADTATSTLPVASTVVPKSLTMSTGASTSPALNTVTSVPHIESTFIPPSFTTITTISSSATINTVIPTPPIANTVVVIPSSLLTSTSASISPTINTIVPLTLTASLALISSSRLARNELTRPTGSQTISTRSYKGSSPHDQSPLTILVYIGLALLITAIILLLIIRILNKSNEQDDLPYTTKPPRPGLRKRLSLSVNIRRASDASTTSSRALRVTGNAVNIERADGKKFGIEVGSESRDREVRRTPSGLLLDV